MKNFIFAFFSIAFFFSCGLPPRNFTCKYKKQNTGLDNLIDIEGYYVSEFGCDSTFFSVYMFYPDGLFTIATTSKISDELIECFINGGTSNICRYPLWGTYQIEGDVIKTQTLRREADGCVIFRDYRILPNKRIINISDFVEPEHTSLGYMGNYPSFRENECKKTAKFYLLKYKRKTTECPFINKKWFLYKN